MPCLPHFILSLVNTSIGQRGSILCLLGTLFSVSLIWFFVKMNISDILNLIYYAPRYVRGYVLYFLFI